MDLKEKFAAIKKKGFKLNFISIPTRPKPRQIEHNIREEFERARVIRMLERIQVFLDGIEAFGGVQDTKDLTQLTGEINSLIRQLKSYKK